MDRYTFRAKAKGTNDWVYGAYKKWLTRQPCPVGDSVKEKDIRHVIIIDGFADWNMPRGLESVDIDIATLGQCTGCRDSKQKLIFEGDIVRYTQDYYGDNSDMNNWDTAVVVWEGEFNYPAFDLKYHSFDSNAFSELLAVGARIEIVGNIHDNPELLEEAIK